MFERLLGNQKFGHHLGDGVKAYQNHKSRETTLISLVEDWKLVVDNRLLEGILSTDMPKALYSLHPPIMPRKLQAYGFQDRALDLLRSYLDNRLGRRCIGSVTSSWRSVERGCPQESVSGPLFWNIFQNDLSYNLDSPISMYANDLQIYEKSHAMCTVLTKLQGSATLTTVPSSGKPEKNIK